MSNYSQAMEKKLTSTETELSIKLERVQRLLAKFDLNALLINRSNNFSWLTCGADSYINIADSFGSASLLITPNSRFVLTDNIEAPRLMQEEGLVQQGWEFQISPWFEGKDKFFALTKGLKLGADADFPNAANISTEIAQLRSQLTAEEGARFRKIGALCAQGMRQAVNAVAPGMTEHEIAGLLAQAAESRGLQATVNLVATDERIFSYRHPLPTSKQLRKYAMLVLCGRKSGLVCSITRLVHFGRLPEDVRHKAEAVARIDAEMIAATRPGRTLGDVFHKAQLAYAAVGFPDEWQRHHQGGPAGYAPREGLATPASAQPILVGQAFAWNPSIAGSKSEDTILVGEHSNEVITDMADWPAIDVQVDDHIIKRPAILEK